MTESRKKIDIEDHENMPKFIISVAAKMLGMHPQTLRQYEKRGFVSPFRMGTLRLYSERDIELLNRVKELADEGIPTSGIDRILELEFTLSVYKKRIKELERENSLLRERMRKEIPPLPVKIEVKQYNFRFYDDDENK